LDVHKKNEKKTEFSSPEWLEQGEQWGYTCIKRNSYFFASFAVGKWTQSTCEKMFAGLVKRIDLPTFTDRLKIFSDGNDDYTATLPKFFKRDCINYGQLIKIRKNGRVVDKIHKVVYGSLSIDEIETTNVENYNGILRGSLSRLVRKTKCFGKKVSRLENALYLFQFYWNFMHPLKKNLTPAIMEGQATKVWTWGNFLHVKLKYL
jgi:hypothetical protein